MWWLGWGGGRLGGHRQEGQGKEEAEGRLPQAGRGRGEPGAWGGGGRSNIVAGAHQVLAVSLNKKKSQQLWGVEAGSHSLLQPAASPH